MIKKIEIENFKSIDKLELELGRFNVFIGENGCGKTNILEAIAFSSCSDDMENSKLSLKGIRVADSIYFRAGFNKLKSSSDIVIKILESINDRIIFTFSNDNQPYSKWNKTLFINYKVFSGFAIDTIDNFSKRVNDLKNSFSISEDTDKEELVQLELEINELKNKYNFEEQKQLNEIKQILNIEEYIIYSPENYFLRNFNIDTPFTQPMGTKGEGLLKLIKVIKHEKPEEYKEIIEHLHLIDWFSDVEITEDGLSGTEFKLKDTYLEDGIGGFDIRNANEGFFLLLFYITLFVSDYTPKFFAIDNIDTALNPKLCTKLIEILVDLAKKHDKQILITTQNPAILDGINLNDDEQRLMVVSRNNDGYTRARRIEKKEPLPGEKSMKLSEQFLRGYIGGLPKNF